WARRWPRCRRSTTPPAAGFLLSSWARRPGSSPPWSQRSSRSRSACRQPGARAASESWTHWRGLYEPRGMGWHSGLGVEGGGAPTVRGLRQIAAITILNLRNLPQRVGTSLVVIVGIAGVVGVLVAVLAMAEGFRYTLASTGRQDRVIMLRAGS